MNEPKDPTESWRDRFREDNRLLINLFRGPVGKVYLAIAVGTLLFQWRPRMALCGDFGDCSLSIVKGVIWSLAWPIYWWGYATNFSVFKLGLHR